MKRILQLCVLACSLTLTSQAQITLTTKVKKEVVDSLSKALVNNYVFPDTARRMSAIIQKNLASGVYDSISDPWAFAQKLTRDLRSVYRDLHMSMNYNPQVEKNLSDTSSNRNSDNSAKDKAQNFGFKKLEILQGNIGYMRFDQFCSLSEEAKTTIKSAFSFLRNSDALIIDVRTNGGGEPQTVQYICNFLFAKRTHINDLYEHRTNKTDTFWTEPMSGYTPFTTIPVYVLTSKRTFSAAEEFSYDLQCQGRAQTVGETTGGGAHPVSFQLVGHGFIAMVPYARAINPITHTNWEAVGVKPDVAVNSDTALDAALFACYGAQLAIAKDSEKIKAILWCKNMLDANLHPHDIDSATLRSYTGKYGDEIFTYKGGALYMAGRSGKTSRLIALSLTAFKAVDFDNYKVEFMKNDGGQINQLLVTYDDGYTRMDAKEN